MAFKMNPKSPMVKHCFKLKDIPAGNKGLAKLPEDVRNTMGFKYGTPNKMIGCSKCSYGKRKCNCGKNLKDGRSPSSVFQKYSCGKKRK